MKIILFVQFLWRTLTNIMTESAFILYLRKQKRDIQSERTQYNFKLESHLEIIQINLSI